VDNPPWKRHRAFPNSTLTKHLPPARVFAPHRGRCLRLRRQADRLFKLPFRSPAFQDQIPALDVSQIAQTAQPHSPTVPGGLCRKNRRVRRRMTPRRVREGLADWSDRVRSGHFGNRGRAKKPTYPVNLACLPCARCERQRCRSAPSSLTNSRRFSCQAIAPASSLVKTRRLITHLVGVVPFAFSLDDSFGKAHQGQWESEVERFRGPAVDH
jgi:hypothetical protein